MSVDTTALSGRTPITDLVKALLVRVMRSESTVLLSGGAVLVLIVFLGAMSSRIAQEHAEEALLASEINRVAQAVVSDLVDMETAQRGYALSSDKDYLEPWLGGRREYAEHMANLRAMSTRLRSPSRDVQALIEHMAGLAETKIALVARNIALVEGGQMDAARQQLSKDGSKAVMDAIRVDGEALDRWALALRQSELAAMRSNSLIFTALTGLGMVLFVALVALFSWLSARRIRELDNIRSDLATVNADLAERVRARTASVFRANEELQRYAYIISHDLRAPLVNIMGFTSELARAREDVERYLASLTNEPDNALRSQAQLAVNDDMPEALDFIRTSITRMDQLINEILKLSRAGRRNLEPETIELNALVQESVDAIQQRFSLAGVTVVVEDAMPSLVTDKVACQQIITNLLDNAAKYTSSERAGEIRVRAYRQGIDIVIEVEDNGRGVAAADQERIFELFRRAGQQDRPGEGIGLAHTRALARRLGGDVKVESDGRSGSLFRVTLVRDLRFYTGDMAQ